jgi:hypothetical protein
VGQIRTSPANMSCIIGTMPVFTKTRDFHCPRLETAHLNRAQAEIERFHVHASASNCECETFAHEQMSVEPSWLKVAGPAPTRCTNLSYDKTCALTKVVAEGIKTGSYRTRTRTHKLLYLRIQVPSFAAITHSEPNKLKAFWFTSR